MSGRYLPPAGRMRMRHCIPRRGMGKTSIQGVAKLATPQNALPPTPQGFIKDNPCRDGDRNPQ